MEESTKNNECNGIVNYLPQDAKNGIIIAPPDGFEVDKIEVVDGYLHATFKADERKLPKTWEEFCEMYPYYTGEYYINPDSGDKIVQVWEMSECEKRTYRNAELLPDRATAEAILALCQLIQLRNCYNGDWLPDWNDVMATKHCIFFEKSNICSSAVFVCPDFLYFKTKELRDEFLRNFRPLIEKLKPLYGIKEGGEE